MKSFILTVLIMLLLTPDSISQEGSLLTLDEAIQIALENNYEIRIAQNDAAIAENNHTIGNAGFLPEAGVSVSQTYTKADSEQEFIGNTSSEVEGAKSNSFNALAGINWTIFDGMLMFTTYEQLQVLQQQELLDLQLSMENTIADVMDVYYQIILIKENIYAIELALELSEEVRDLAATKQQIGAGSGLEVLQAEVDLNEDMSVLIDQQEQLAIAKIQLNNLLARPVGTDFSVTDSILIARNLEYSVLSTKAMSENTTLKISRSNEYLAGLDLKAVRSQHYPTLQLNLGYYYNKSQSEAGYLLSNKQNGLQYGATFQYNIFNGFNVQRQKENAKISIQSAALAREALELDVNTALLTAYTQYENNLVRLELEERNLASAERTMEITLERYQLGDIAGIEMREARQRYLAAQSRYVLAVYNAKLAEVELRRLSGQLVQAP